MNRKAFVSVSVAAFCAMAALSSCSSGEDAFNSSSLDELHKKMFVENFVTKYGEIPANKSWDFTTGDVQLTRGYSAINTVVLDQGIDSATCRRFRGSSRMPNGCIMRFRAASRRTMTCSLPSLQPCPRRRSGLASLLFW